MPLSPGCIFSLHIERALGVEAIMDLAFKVSVVTAHRFLHWAPAPSHHPPLAPEWEQNAARSCWQLGLWRSQALDFASTICTLINVFNLTILYQPRKITMHKLLFKLEAAPAHGAPCWSRTLH